MVVTIPVCPGLRPDKRVPQSIYDQGIPQQNVVTVQAGFPYSQLTRENNSIDRRSLIKNICIARNACLDFMSKSLLSCDVAAMNDADEMHLCKDSLTLAHLFLNNNPEYAAVGLYDGRIDQNDPDHIMLGCWVMHRRFFALNLKFDFTWPGCECLDMCQKIKAAGLRACYLDMEKRLENLKCL
jgi:hypothetical protein